MSIDNNVDPRLASAQGNQDEGGINFNDYVDLFLDNIYFLFAATVVGFVLGFIRSELIPPMYEAEATVQIEILSTAERQLTESYLGAPKFLLNTEMEIIRSRKLQERVAINTQSYIYATPRRIPVVGSWLSRQENGLSDPIALPFREGLYTYGTESIEVENLEIPPGMPDAPIVLKVIKPGQYQLEGTAFKTPLKGEVGQPVILPWGGGVFVIKVNAIQAKPSAEFVITRQSVTDKAESMRTQIIVGEKVPGSGILRIAYQDTDKVRAMRTVNEVGQQYLQQNLEKRSADVEKSIGFLNQQIPYYKTQLAAAEEHLTEFRQKNGGGSVDGEATYIISKLNEFAAKKADIESRQLELSRKYTPEHPVMQTLGRQISNIEKESEGIKTRLATLPTLQQEMVRLLREVTLINETLNKLNASALQLQLIKEGKINNIRFLDVATEPRGAISPNKFNIRLFGVVLGAFAGLAWVLFRYYTSQSLEDTLVLEKKTGIPQFAAIPFSQKQADLEKRGFTGKSQLLCQLEPNEMSVEVLRSMCSALLFSLARKPHSVILISGPTPSIGKSYISGNAAALLATLGKKVLLIDADLRKGHLNKPLGLSKTPGLSDILVEDKPLASAQVIKQTETPNLDCVTTGHFPADPARMFLSATFSRWLDEVRLGYDIVLIDSAPILAAADTAVLASYADAVLLVVRAGASRSIEVIESARRLNQAGSRVNGYIFNGFDPSKRSSGYHYGYGYKYGNGYAYAYGHEHKAKDKSWFSSLAALFVRKPKVQKDNFGSSASLGASQRKHRRSADRPSESLDSRPARNAQLSDRTNAKPADPESWLTTSLGADSGGEESTDRSRYKKKRSDNDDPPFRPHRL